jgi:hypothetical protein
MTLLRARAQTQPAAFGQLIGGVVIASDSEATQTN